MSLADCGQDAKQFIHFFDKLNENVFSLNAMIRKIDEFLPDIAPSFLIGKLKFLVSVPPSVYEPKGVFNTDVGYVAPDGFEVETFEKQFTTPEGGKVSIILNPSKGVIWTDADKEGLTFFCQELFMLCSRARLMGMLRHVERTDALTGALNSKAFMEESAKLVMQRKGSAYTAIFINIKNFKYINQQVGQNNGNVILCKFGMMLNSYIGENGYFSRLGGDNFMAMIKNETFSLFLRFMQGIIISLEHEGKTVSMHITTKMGVYRLTPQSTPGDVMTNPNVAFLVAKRSQNHDVIFFRPEMLEESLHAKGISNMFPESLARKEFLVYYQPKVDLRTKTLCGAEALSRWKRDRIIPPVEFIPVLENEGSIRNLDFYVLEAVCCDIRDWLNKGYEPVRVSTNFSKVHLSNEKLEQDIMNVLNAYEIPAKYLEIELTELSDYKYYDRLIAFVNNMHGYGVHISIDDFGTGYSSIKLFKDLQADVIKLDKSLIDNIAENGSKEADKIISRAIINMANELNVAVIAEGVETVYQADFLLKNGCTMAQGYLFDRPLTHDAFEKILSGDRTYTLPDASPA